SILLRSSRSFIPSQLTAIGGWHMDPVTNTYLTRHFGDEVGVLLAEMTRESVRFSSLESAVDYWDVKSRFSLRGGIRLIEPASSRIALSTGKQYILVPHHILTPEMIDAFAT